MPKLQRAAPQGSWIVGGYALALPAMRHPVFLVVVIAGQKVYCCNVVLIDSALQHKR